MTSWQTESPSVPAWGDMGHFSQFPLTSLRDVLEASQAQEVYLPSLNAALCPGHIFYAKEAASRIQLKVQRTVSFRGLDPTWHLSLYHPWGCLRHYKARQLKFQIQYDYNNNLRSAALADGSFFRMNRHRQPSLDDHQCGGQICFVRQGHKQCMPGCLSRCPEDLPSDSSSNQQDKRPPLINSGSSSSSSSSSKSLIHSCCRQPKASQIS